MPPTSRMYPSLATESVHTVSSAGYAINYSGGGVLSYGVYSSANYTTIKNCRINETYSSTLNKHGIYFYGASYGYIYNNTIIVRSGQANGIRLETNAKINNISNNNISTNGISYAYGIIMASNADYNRIYNNTISTLNNQGYGLYFSTGADSNYAEANHVKAQSNIYSFALFIYLSENNTFVNNDFNATTAQSVAIEGIQTSQYNHTLLRDNYVHGLPINYTYNVSGRIYSNIDYTPYGQVIFAACENIVLNSSNISTDGLSLFFVNYSNITNNVINATHGYGIYMVRPGNYSILENNTIETFGSYGYGLWMSTSINYNIIRNLSILTHNSSANGIYMSFGDYHNIFQNINITVANSSSFGIWLLTTKNTSFSNISIITNGSSSYPVYIYDSGNNFTMTDGYLQSNNKNYAEVYYRNLVNNGVWNFTNISQVNGDAIRTNWTNYPNGTMNVMWYVIANASLGTNPLQNVNITMWDNNTNLQFSINTSANGYIPKQTLLGYTNTNNSNITYYSNYSINGTYPSYTTYKNNSINLTTNIFVYMIFSSDTCSCAGLNTNWNVSMDDRCNITTDCNLGTGMLTYYGTSGFFNCSANINTSDMGIPPTSTYLWVNSACKILVS